MAAISISDAALTLAVQVGIVLFGYDTGIAGGVVTQKAFKDEFLPGATQAHVDAVSQNVVSVLQAGAFFGALGSIPITSAIGRKYTLLGFSLLFSLGAVSWSAQDPVLRVLFRLLAPPDLRPALSDVRA